MPAMSQATLLALHDDPEALSRHVFGIRLVMLEMEDMYSTEEVQADEALAAKVRRDYAYLEDLAQVGSMLLEAPRVD